MAKSNKKTNRNQQPKKKKGNTNAGKSGNSGGPRLDTGARDYARLLNDPCYGQLTLPLYDSAGSGQLVRVECDFVLGAEATSVGAAVIFRPGVVTASGFGGVYIPTTVVASDSGSITWNCDFAKTPGYALLTLMGSCRAVSACMQVQYLGPEQTRAGVISLCQVPSSVAIQTATLASLRQLAERVVRTPDGTLEIKLTPTGHSEELVSSGGFASPENHPALVASVSGIPNSTGVRVRLVQVLEWTPKAGSGALAGVATPESGNTINQVLRAMAARNPNWRYDLLTGMGSYAARALLL